MGVTVRDAEEHDAEAVARLLHQLGYPTTTTQARQRLLETAPDPDARVIAAEHAGEVVGLVSVRASSYFPTGARILRIDALITSDAHRRLGVASALVTAVLSMARQQRCYAVEVTTADSRDDAHAFYEQLGFSRTSRRYFRPLSGEARSVDVDAGTER